MSFVGPLRGGPWISPHVAEIARAAQATEAARAAANPPRRDEISLRGRKLALLRFGAEPYAAETSVILTHGSAEHGGRWAALGAGLPKEVAAAAPDLPGCGRSDPSPEDDNPIFAHDVAALSELVAESVGRVFLVGVGFGAIAASRVALRCGERLAGLCLVEPAAFSLLEQAQDPKRLGALDLAAGVAAKNRFGEREEAARIAYDFWRGEGAFATLNPEARAYAIASADRLAAETRAFSQYAPGALRFEDFEAIKAPMLVVCGLGASPALRAAAARIRRAAPQAEALNLAARAAAATGETDAAIRRFLKARIG